MIHRTIRFILLIVFVAIIPIWSFAQTINTSDVKKFTDNYFSTKLDEYHVPGAVFIMVKDGKVIYSQGYGYADLDKKIKPDPAKTIYRVASNSKLFIATAVMQLYQQGKLKLDTDVNSYLDVKVIPGNSYPPVNLRHLLTHTPGFDDINVRMSTLEKEKRLTLEQFIKERTPDRVYPPGTVTSYSNYGYALAGYIVERTSGQSFSAYVNDNIFKPLGMNSSSFVINKSLRERLATPYVYADQSYQALPYDYIFPYPATTLMTTADDMARFMIMHLNNGSYAGQRVLDDRTIRMMHAQQFTNHEKLPGMTFGYIEDIINDIRILHHTGWVTGHKTLQVLVPGKNFGYFIAGNFEYVLSNPYKIFNDFNRTFFNHYFPYKNNIDTLQHTTVTIETFEGNYRTNRYDRDTIAKLGILMNDIKVSVVDENTLRIKDKTYTRKSNLLFIENDGNEKIGFRLDENGKSSFFFKASNPTAGYERLPWYETSGFHMILLGICVVLFLTSPLFFYFVLRNHKKSDYQLPVYIKRGYLVASLNGILYVVFFAAMGIILLNTIQISMWWETPSPIPFLLILPLLCILVTLYMIYLAVKMWKVRALSILERTYYSILTLACVVFTVFLDYFNLVGYNI